MERLANYLRLMRVSLLPTAWSNILVGFALTLMPNGVPASFVELALLIACSSCLYLSGMVLNDVFDYELDCRERPERVLPSGKISRKAASILGFGLMAIGIAIAAWLSILNSKTGPLLQRPALGVAICIAAMSLYYNLRAKHTIFGPFVMGSCRGLNVLLGCSLIQFEQGIWFVPLAMALYVAGITWFARDEQDTSSRKNLIAGALLMACAAALLFWYPFTSWYSFNYTLRHGSTPPDRQFLYVGLLAMMLFPVVRKVLVAIATRQSRDVKMAVVTCLLTIILIDASVCYLASPTTPAYALCVASLVVPAFFMSRRIMAT